MKLRFWNTNYAGPRFGGSLFAMTDAFHMLILMANLEGTIALCGTRLRASAIEAIDGDGVREFRLSDGQVKDVREKLKTLPKYEPVLSAGVEDEAGVVMRRGGKGSARAKKIESGK